MRCRHVLSLLSSYIDDELAPEEKQGIEGHIEDCEECARALLELGETVRRIQTIEEVPVPRELTERIKADLSDRQETREARDSFFARRFLRYALVFSGLIAFTIAIIIPLKAIQYMRSEMKNTGTLSSAPRSGSANDAPDVESRNKTQESVPLDGIHAGDRVRLSTANYNSKGVDTLRDYYKEKEQAESDTAQFRQGDREAAVSDLFEEANNLKLDSRQLAKCMDKINAENEATIPIYAEKAKYEGQEVWIIVVKAFAPPHQGFGVSVSVFAAETAERIYLAAAQ